MESLSHLHHHHQPFSSSLDHNHPSLKKPISSHFLSPPNNPFLLLPSIKASSSDSTQPNPQIPQTPLTHFLNSLPKITSFATLTALSALFFNGYYQKSLLSNHISPSPIKESLVEGREMEGLIGCEHVSKSFDGFSLRSVRFLKLKEEIPVVYDFKRLKCEDEAWMELKSDICSCCEELEVVKIGFEEILEKDPYGVKSYHGRVLEYLEMVDECKGILRDIKRKMDKCERENGNNKYFLRLLTELVDRVRVLQGYMLGALKFYQENEQE